MCYDKCISGGGLYDEGDGFKNGQWIDLDDEFNNKK